MIVINFQVKLIFRNNLSCEKLYKEQEKESD